ncbi:hypothetical protein J3F84DRAFT_349940 [Trichoderma pleuroticola]
MKFLATVGVLATAAVAAPSPEANPEPWCYRIGEPCWKIKRSAEAFVSTIQSVGGLESRDEHKGIPNDIALSAIQGLDQLSTLILYASEDPTAFLENGTETAPAKREVEVKMDRRWCYRIGMPCWIPKRSDAEIQEEKREVEIQEEKRWCYRIGMPCWIPKRGDAEVQEEKREVEVQEEKRWCYRIGMPCWIPKRSDEVSEEKRACFQNGGDCWKAKRVAEAVLAATLEGDEKRDVEEETPEKKWCYRIGQPCWKAKRDVELIQDVARGAIEGMY